MAIKLEDVDTRCIADDRLPWLSLTPQILADDTDDIEPRDISSQSCGDHPEARGVA